ncbi:MAG: DUF4011 domain-containing protein [Bacteroidales bacterium]|nr:DUF4011 domain-containing protein [Bacteroidales bacterium]
MNKQIQTWANKLLDTGNRNNLVNFKDRKGSTLEFVFHDPAEIFDSLAHGKSFEFFNPKEWFKSNSSKEEEFPKTMSCEDFCDKFSAYLGKNDCLAFNLFDADSGKIVKRIEQQFSSEIEETGVNAGYVFFGLIEWKDGNSVYKAPLLLLPIKIVHEKKNDPYTIVADDDDIVVNPTFNYKIKAEFDVELPEYDEDDGLLTYLAQVQRIVERFGWNVSSCCKLGRFSFQKINMYNDLMENESVVLDNPNIKQLLGESTTGDDSSSDGGIVDLGENFNELVDIHNVVDADSSQLDAIKMAKSGKSFVLQGPPGTGKSQTIANIIAECLFDGKKVLFVSEKQAALNVVFEKMKQVGLSDFCLELHSNKAKKKDVVRELDRTLKLPQFKIKLNEYSQKVQNQRKLDEYDHSLHREWPVIKKSAYVLYNDYLRYKNAVDVEFLIKNVSQKDESYREKLTDAISRYAEYETKIGTDYKQSPWFGFVSQDTSIQGKADLKEDFSSLISSIQDVLPTVSSLNDVYGIDCSSIQCVKEWLDFLKRLPELKGLVPCILNSTNLGSAVELCKKMKSICSELDNMETSIGQAFDSDIYALDGKHMNKQLKLYDSFFSRIFSKEYRQIKQSLKLSAKQGCKINYESACTYTQQLAEYQDRQKQFDSCNTSVFGSCFSGRKTDWNRLEQRLQQAQLCLNHGKGSALVASFSQDLFNKACDEFGNVSDNFVKFIDQTDNIYSKIQQKFDSSIFNCRNSSFNEVVKKISCCLNDFDHLEHWKLLNVVIGEIKELNALDYVDFCKDNGVALSEMKDAYNKRFYSLWIDYVKNSDGVLGYFDRISHTAAVEKFTEEDKSDLNENRKRIKSALQNQRPSPNCDVAGSGIWVINHEAKKEKKIKPIRRLISEVGTTIQAIKPCFLMSPLSVSTFIPSKSISFDTVIFDEASQIFPQDAFGAIYRGSQIIVVGDSKQMPPTNFFSADLDAEDEDDYDSLSDYESILDLCSTSFKQQSLLWHYRSRYEQLIAFSNHNFYDGRLITFPSATIDQKGIGVDFYHVDDGFFIHKARHNIKEAERVVDLILEHVKTHPERSLGVVAFSVAQQDLIENLLSKRTADTNEYDILFDKGLQEPFFIKNLESVQGDERDTIIFSIAYGREESGRFILNFGPLNRQGGERRLNVAVSRARINVQVVSSIKGSDIDLTRSQSNGVHLLKQYLDFAEKGPSAFPGKITVNDEDEFDSIFEMEVCDFLREQGFTVDTQVGCSGFRIDLGVRKPESSEYFLAVECDGATYHSSKNARDRDRLRQEILEKMGWNFYRIWSTDWFRHEKDEKAALLDAVKDAEKQGVRIVAKSQKRKTELVEENPVVEEPKEKNSFPEFRYMEHISFGDKRTSDYAENIKVLLSQEIAISKKVLLDRIVEVQYGKKRASKLVEKEFESDISACLHYGIEERNGFLYLEGTTDVPFRIPGDKRPVEDISLEELANGMLVFIKQGISVGRIPLFKKINSLLGFDRLGSNIQERFDQALGLLSNEIVVDGDRISLK